MKKARVQINFKLLPAFYNVLLCMYFEIRRALHVKRARKSTSWGVSGMKISFAANQLELENLTWHCIRN